MYCNNVYTQWIYQEYMVSLLFQNGDTKYHVLVSQKSTRFVLSTRFYRLYLVGIDSILSTSSGKDRLDVFYQLDLATASGRDRLDSKLAT